MFNATYSGVLPCDGAQKFPQEPSTQHSSSDSWRPQQVKADSDASPPQGISREEQEKRLRAGLEEELARKENLLALKTKLVETLKTQLAEEKAKNTEMITWYSVELASAKAQLDDTKKILAQTIQIQKALPPPGCISQQSTSTSIHLSSPSAKAPGQQQTTATATSSEKSAIQLEREAATGELASELARSERLKKELASTRQRLEEAERSRETSEYECAEEKRKRLEAEQKLVDIIVREQPQPLQNKRPITCSSCITTSDLSQPNSRNELLTRCLVVMTGDEKLSLFNRIMQDTGLKASVKKNLSAIVDEAVADLKNNRIFGEIAGVVAKGSEKGVDVAKNGTHAPKKETQRQQPPQEKYERKREHYSQNNRDPRRSSLHQQREEDFKNDRRDGERKRNRHGEEYEKQKEKLQWRSNRR